MQVWPTPAISTTQLERNIRDCALGWFDFQMDRAQEKRPPLDATDLIMSGASTAAAFYAALAHDLEEKSDLAMNVAKELVANHEFFFQLSEPNLVDFALIQLYVAVVQALDSRPYRFPLETTPEGTTAGLGDELPRLDLETVTEALASRPGIRYPPGELEDQIAEANERRLVTTGCPARGGLKSLGSDFPLAEEIKEVRGNGILNGAKAFALSYARALDF